MARPTQDRMAVNRGLFADIYKDCCKNEAECKILDIIIAQFLLNEVFKGDEQTERAIAKVTGLSKSGVRVVQGRAMKKMKDSLVKGGIRKVEDVVDSSSRSSVAAKSNDSVDESCSIFETDSDDKLFDGFFDPETDESIKYFVVVMKDKKTSEASFTFVEARNENEAKNETKTKFPNAEIIYVQQEKNDASVILKSLGLYGSSKRV